MKALSPQEMDELRADCAGLNLSPERLADLIRLLDNIAISIVAQECGWHSVQLSLSARANYAFNSAENNANLPFSGTSGPVDLDCHEGANNTITDPKGPRAP